MYLKRKIDHYVVVNNYLIFYTIDEKSEIVYIRRLIYGSRNILSIII